MAANTQQIPVKIPGAERATVDAAKVRDYLLSPEHRVGSAKARFFAQLGFEQGWALVPYKGRPGEALRSLSCGSCSMVRTFQDSSPPFLERSYDRALQ